MKKESNKIFIISGPSGVGKTSVAKGVLKKLRGLKTTTTYTTRNIRLGKKEDKNVIHVSEDKFREKVAADKFLEWAFVHGNFYGTDAKVVYDNLKSSSLLMNIDIQGALQIKKKLPQKTVLIFLKAESFKELIARIRRREKMPAAILQLRLKNAKRELKFAKRYNYIVINKRNMLKQTISQIENIIKNELEN